MCDRTCYTQLCGQDTDYIWGGGWEQNADRHRILQT